MVLNMLLHLLRRCKGFIPFLKVTLVPQGLLSATNTVKYLPSNVLTVRLTKDHHNESSS